jgi:hypothetical protein
MPLVIVTVILTKSVYILLMKIIDATLVDIIVMIKFICNNYNSELICRTNSENSDGSNKFY